MGKVECSIQNFHLISSNLTWTKTGNQYEFYRCISIEKYPRIIFLFFLSLSLRNIANLH
jgi:hypothetical protein